MTPGHKIIVVSELFFPEESATAHIVTRIASYLSKDRDVLVVSGPPSYEAESARREAASALPDQLSVVRVWAPALNKNQILSRVLRVLIMSFALSWKVFRIAQAKDVLFSVTNPAPLVVFLALLKGVLKVKYVLLVHDVFPENAVAIGLLRGNGLIYRLAKVIFDWAYGKADAIVVIGRDMASVVESKIEASQSDRIHVIENWCDIPYVRPIQRSESRIPYLGLQQKLVFHYSGNIGRAQGLLGFVEAIRCLQNPSIHFMFSGGGALFEDLNRITAGLDFVSLSGPYARSTQNDVLGSCDVGLVILAEGMFGLGVPSKTYNLMAAGKPILFLGPAESEIYRLVKEESIGWAFSWAELDLLMTFFGSLSLPDLVGFEQMGVRARAVAEARFAEDVVLAQYGVLFNDVTRDC